MADGTLVGWKDRDGSGTVRVYGADGDYKGHADDTGTYDVGSALTRGDPIRFHNSFDGPTWQLWQGRITSLDYRMNPDGGATSFASWSPRRFTLSPNNETQHQPGPSRWRGVPPEIEQEQRRDQCTLCPKKSS